MRLKSSNWGQVPEDDDLVDFLHELSERHYGGCYLPAMHLFNEKRPAEWRQSLAIRVADAVVTPVRCEALAMDGVAATLQQVRAVGRPQQIIVLPMMYDGRFKAQRYNYRLLQEAYGGIVAGGPLGAAPNRAALAEAHLEGKTVWEYRGGWGRMVQLRAAFEQLVAWLTTRGDEVLFGEGVRT